MKKLLLSLLVMSALVLAVVPGVLAVSAGSGLDVNIVTEQFPPAVWQCDHRIVYDDNTEPGRVAPHNGYCTKGDKDLTGLTTPVVKCEDLISETACEANDRCKWHGPEELVERINSYAFTGEQIQWKVLVLDKNGIEKVGDVYVSVDGFKQANCKLDRVLSADEKISDSCNARILEETLKTPGYDNVAAYYTCTLTVESPDTKDGGTNDAFYGSKEVTVEATDLDTQTGVMAEKESWFFNPMINLDVVGGISFDNVRPGTSSYSDMVTVQNVADDGSGVMLDMFISGTDFYDSASSGAKCGSSNQLKLENFAYHATNGAYATKKGVTALTDDEGYRSIQYGIGFNNPNPFYDNNEILPAQKVGPYYTANILAQNNKMALTFRLNLPEPCNGNFDTGQIYFWGEAI